MNMHGNDILRFKGAVTDKVFIGPRRLEIEIITYCNINCYFCWFHSPLIKRKQKKWHLELEKFKQIVDEAQELGINHIYITGRGEPCLHPQIDTLLAYAKSKGLFITLTTNCTIGTKKILQALAMVDLLEITLCAASKDSYKKLQCPKSRNLFDAVIKNISILKKISIRTGRPKIKLIYIMTRHNVTNLPRFVALAEKLEADEVRFTYMSPVPQTQPLLPDKKELHEIEKTIARLARKASITIDDSWKGIFDLKIKKCYVGWFTVLIRVFGDVRIGCFDPPFKPDGNIYKRSFKKIWLSKKAHTTRLRQKYMLNRYASCCPLISRTLRTKGLYCPFALQNVAVEAFLARIKK